MKPFQLVPKAAWPTIQHDPKRFEVWLNKDFLVQVFNEPGGVIRISVNRVRIKRNGSWRDDISWEQLQEIKKRIGYADRYAIEVYPRSVDLVNVANMRHLWILPEPLEIGWFRDSAARIGGAG